MSHVDEGTLHAYLDDELPSAERAALESHLAQCAACRASLAEEQALLERASALLGSARPMERPAPPFEQLRPALSRSPWRVRTSFAWAASIALALGLGYYLRNPDPATPARLEQPVVVAQDRAARSMREEKPTARLLQHSGGRQPAAPTDEVARRSGSVDSGATKVALGTPAASAGPASRSAPVPAADSPSRDAAAVVSGVFAREQRERPSIGAAQSRRADVAPGRRLTANTWLVINRQVARSLLGEEPVGLPGLAPRSFRRTTDGTVVVEQALDSSTFIQIFQRPVSPASLYDSAGGYTAALGSARTDRLLARFVGRLRVEIAGPVSADSLNRLLEQVAPLP